MKNLIRIVAVSLIGLFTSCDLLDQQPETAVTNPHVWSSEKDAESVYNNMQFSLRAQSTASHYWLFGEARARNFDNYTNYTYQHVFNNTFELLSGSGVYNWAEYYTTIGLANLIIDNIHKTPMNAEKKKYLMGSAYFARAMSYFNLLRFWGEAPLIVTSDDVTSTVKASIQDVFDRVILDAGEAGDRLETWSSISAQMGATLYSKQYACQGAVDALLAHAYAWMGSITDDEQYLGLAVEAATRVIESPEYGLMDTYEEIAVKTMNGNSREGIFELEFNTYERGGSATMAYYIVGYPVLMNFGAGDNSTKWPYNEFVISNDLVESIYDEVYNETVIDEHGQEEVVMRRDKRVQNFFHDFDGMKEMDESITKGRAYPAKWRESVYSTDGANTLLSFNANVVVFRLADLILLRAEINNRLGHTGPAVEDLNIIRNRAGIGNYSASVNGDLKLAILKERRRELLYEGHYFFDLVRNGELRNLLSTFSQMTDDDIRDGCFYLPVPAGAFIKNPEMRQNIYWKRNGF